MPLTGVVLHSADQYTGLAASGRFDNGPLAIAAVVAGSAAERAGLRPNDGIESIAGTEIVALLSSAGEHLREVAFAAMAQSEVLERLSLRIRRDNETIDIDLPVDRGCRALVEIRVGSGPNAQTDGRVLQVRYDFAAQLSDNALAVVIAHELAHIVLEHRRRKEAAGIDNGMFASVGRNQQANRAAEIEADRLAPHLLANAGYFAAHAAAFWVSEGPRSSNVLSFVYPSAQARAQLIQREIDRYLPLGRGPSWPGHLLSLRDREFE